MKGGTQYIPPLVLREHPLLHSMYICPLWNRIIRFLIDNGGIFSTNLHRRILYHILTTIVAFQIISHHLKDNSEGRALEAVNLELPS